MFDASSWLFYKKNPVILLIFLMANSVSRNIGVALTAHIRAAMRLLGL
jgi:hypothetical protein